MRSILLCVLLLFISLFSCKQSETVSNFNLRGSLTLELANDERIYLDTASSMKDEVHYLQSGNSEYLIFNNAYAFNRIDIYDLQTQRIYKKGFLQKDGPNGLGAIPSGLYAHNLDSIFIFSNNANQDLKLINSDGHLVNKFGFIYSVSDESPNIEVSSRQRIFKRGTRLYFCNNNVGYSGSQVGAMFDLSDRTTSFLTSTPDIFSDGWWQGLVYDRSFHDFNRERDFIVQSFGNDHNVYVINSQGQKQSHMAKSKYLPEKIKPYSRNRGNFMKEEQQLFRHIALQGAYQTIKYDSWEKVYYRYVCRPVRNSDYHSPSQTWDRLSIVILDEEFNNIGEFDIPKGYSWSQSFVSKRGLSFFNKRAYEGNEDELVFGNFKLKKIGE